MPRTTLLLLFLATALVGCAAKHVVPPEPPVPKATLAPFEAIRLSVRSFSIRGTSGEDQAGPQNMMRQRFLDYLASRGRFAELVDVQTNYMLRGTSHPRPLSLDLEISVGLSHSAWRTWILDAVAVYPFVGTWPLTPQWGTATAEVTAILRDPNAQPLWSVTKKGEVGYDIIWYSWFRTEPLELAYRAAAAQAFERIADELAVQQGAIYAKLGDLVPKETLAAAAPPREDVPPAQRPSAPVQPVAPAIELPPGARASWIVAVMEITDTNSADPRKAVDRKLMRNLSDQLRVFVAQRGLRVIDRGQQERAIRELTQEVKAESYKECFDTTCQIPLGKALAASHLLRSQVTRFGSACVLNGELIDLKREVTVAAGSARADCSEEGFLTASENVTSSLLASTISGG